jgi:hypothetical protein
MDLSVVILISAGAAIILGLVFCFFGYKLGRLLFPVCGLLVIESLIYIYVYKQMQFDIVGTWMLFGGSGVAVYIILFFIKRIAGFFTGLLGSALFALYVVSALGLQDFEYIVPAVLCFCIVSGLLTAVYQKYAVIVFTALFGACVAAFAGIYIYIQGVDASALSAAGLFAVLGSFLTANAIFIAGASAGVCVSGILIQSALTSSSCVLAGRADGGGRPAERETPEEAGRKEEEGRADRANTGYFNIK